jgi:polar amino acid transport system permease protein
MRPRSCAPASQHAAGQLEAARSLAMTERQVFLRVVLPPALGRVWPALVSQIVIVMLGSAVCGQISAQELSYYTNLIASRNFRAFEANFVIGAAYLALAMGAAACSPGPVRAGSSAK